MVYHLRNWKLVRDFFATDPKFAGEVVSDILRVVSRGVGFEIEVNPALGMEIAEKCGKATSKEGFEMCIVSVFGALLYRQGLWPNEERKEKGREVLDKLLKELDNTMDLWRVNLYEKHVWWW